MPKMCGYCRMLRLLANRLILHCAVLLLCIAGCCSHLPAGPGEGSFRGEVVYLDIEGGFYGIVTQGGMRLKPMHLPARYRHDGLLVQGKYRSLEDRMTLQMWGRPVELTDIERIKDRAQ